MSATRGFPVNLNVILENHEEFLHAFSNYLNSFHEDHHEGEIDIKDLSNLKIKFNLLTGVVNTVHVETENRGVKHSYDGACKSLIFAIKEAIALKAKCVLLNFLLKLNDAQITQIIHQNHFQHSIFNMPHHLSDVDETLREIQKLGLTKSFLVIFGKPAPNQTQKIISEVLQQQDIDNIRFIEDVTKIINAINAKQEQVLQPLIP